MSHPDQEFTRQGALLSALQPLRRRIPLTMTMVLAVIVAAMLWFGYDRVYDSVISAETARLHASARQLALTLAGQVRRIRSEDARFARTPQLARAASLLATPSDRAEARKLLAAERARSPVTHSIALWSPDGKRLLGDGPQDAPPPGLESRAQASDSADVGPLVQKSDTILYSTVSPISDGAGRAIAFVTVTRRVASSAENAALLSGLVGKGAELLLGNSGGGLWTDFVNPLRGPGLIDGAKDGDYTDRNRIERLLAAMPLAETPWMVAVDVPRDEAVTAAREFVWRMLGLALGVLLIGASLGWGADAKGGLVGR